MDIPDEQSWNQPPIRPRVRGERRCLIVLGGLPGAGKTTLLAKLDSDFPLVVLDSEQVRAPLRELLPRWVPYALYRVLVHSAHRCRIAWYCVFSRRAVVAHEPSTRASTRALLIALGRLGGRQRLLLWLTVDPETALLGQQNRGRLTRTRSFRRHVRREARLRAAWRVGRGSRGWAAVHEFTRERVSAGIRIVPVNSTERPARG